MKDNMIMVKSMTDSTVVVNVPDLRLTKTWTKRGSRLPIPKDVLEQAIYDTSVDTLLKEGLLYIEDLKFKQEIGLEPDDATTAVNIIELSENLMARLIKTMPIKEFETTLDKLTSSQKEDLANYAILHYADLSMDRIERLTKATGINLLVAIENHKKSLEN